MTRTTSKPCYYDDCPNPAVWHVFGVGPGCSDGFSCCGWAEDVCEEHKADAMSVWPEMTAERIDGTEG